MSTRLNCFILHFLQFIVIQIIDIDGAKVFEHYDADEEGGPHLDITPSMNIATGCCSNLPAEWGDIITSVDPEGGCIILCDGPDCGGRCETFTEINGNFVEIGFDDAVQSYKACTCKKKANTGGIIIKRSFCRGFPIVCLINDYLSQYWPYLPWVLYPLSMLGLIPSMIYNLFLFFKQNHFVDFDIDKHELW